VKSGKKTERDGGVPGQLERRLIFLACSEEFFAISAVTLFAGPEEKPEPQRDAEVFAEIAEKIEFQNPCSA